MSLTQYMKRHNVPWRYRVMAYIVMGIDVDTQERIGVFLARVLFVRDARVPGITGVVSLTARPQADSVPATV